VQELEGSTARETAKLASGNISCLKHHVQFMNGDWLGGGSYQLFGFPGV